MESPITQARSAADVRPASIQSPPSPLSSAQAAAGAGATDASRLAFAPLWMGDAHPGAWSLADDVLAAAFASVERDPSGDVLPLDALMASAPTRAGAWIEASAGWRDAHTRPLVAALHALPASSRHAWARHLVPAAVADGAWLARASAPVRSHEEASACLVRAWRRRHEGAHGHFVPRPLAALRRIGIAQAGEPPASLARDTGIDDAMFDWPVLGMALGRYPVRYVDEILGFHLAASLLGGDPIGSIDPATRPWPSALDTTSASPTGHDDVADVAAVDEVELALRAIERSSAARSRVLAGARLGIRAWRARRAALVALAGVDRVDAAGRMGQLLRRLGAVAARYHRGRRLGDESLEALFQQAGVDPVPLLSRLARSPFVVAGDAARSPLLDTLAAPGGAMAGVFDENDRAVIAAWIDSLTFDDASPSASPSASASASTSTSTSTSISAPPSAPACAGASAPASTTTSATPVAESPAIDFAALPLREFHRVMLRIDEHPAALPHASRFASAWLARAGAGLERGDDALPFASWDAHAFDAWLARRHDAQVAEGDVAAAMPSREALVDACVQLAPLVLVDGAWLQHWGAPAACATAVGRRLWRIHLDEVGDGEAHANHPNLYRSLLAAMDVDLPPLGSMAFRDWGLLRDASFHVPLYWLCLSMFPSRFLPETLGLTLAVELAGVGGGYRQSRAALRAHGFPTTFVDVHDTVDNVACGHSAMAAEAIRLHLDDVLATAGPEEAQRHWRRVWAGWRSRIAPEGVS